LAAHELDEAGRSVEQRLAIHKSLAESDPSNTGFRASWHCPMASSTRSRRRAKLVRQGDPGAPDAGCGQIAQTG
jgi:hypothetical protein